MPKPKSSKPSTRLISLRLPIPLLTRLDFFVEARLKEKNDSVSFNRSLAIQELLNSALEKVGC